jgi:transketolase
MNTKKKIRQQFADTMLEIGKKNKNLVVLVSDISHGLLKKFDKECKNQYYNLGICEQAIVSTAAGLAKVGFNTVIHTIAPFLIERSYEQIKLGFGYQKIGANFVSVGGTYDYTKLGCTHHSYSDFSLLSHFPSCNIFVPGSAKEFDALFKKNYKKKEINYFRLTEFPHNLDCKINNDGQATKLLNGKDITLVCVGNKLKEGWEAYKELKNKISIELLYYNCVKPIDKKKLLLSARKTKKIIIIEEFSSEGGFFHQCLKVLAKEKNILSESIAIKPFIHDYGSYEYLNLKSGVNKKNIIKKIRKLCKNEKTN